MNKTVIVIGSGVAGLATACRLAHQGFSVEVFEANSAAGGKLGFIGNSQYRFDSGPSLLTLPQLVDQLISDCGKSPQDYFTYYRKDTACHYFWEDGSHLEASGDKYAFAAEAEKQLGEKPENVIQYLEEAEYIYQHTNPVFLEQSLHKVSTYLNATTLNSLIRIHKLKLMGTLHDANAKAFDTDKMVQLFDRFATYNGSSPYLTPGVMSSIPHLEHNIGTYYPHGGMVNIANAMYQLGQDLGVVFHFNTAVEEILVEGGRAKGIRTADKEVYAQTVVSNMDVVPTYRKLLAKQTAPEKTLAQDRSSSALIFYWGIKDEFPQLDLHNIFFSENYKAEFNSIFEDKKVFEDPTVYVNISSKESGSDAPEGCENWFVMINVPGNIGQDWDKIITEVRENTLAKLSRILNRNISDLIEFEEILDPRSIESKTSSYQGSLYGAGSNDTMSAFLRHPNFTKKIKDLYFCGGSVHPGGGIPLCLLSAQITANIIKSDYAR
jgi:phytoene desaturase